MSLLPATDRRALLATALAGTGALVPLASKAAPGRVRFDRTGYDRYIALMNAGDTRFVEYYANDIRFVMNIRGRARVLEFYARQRAFVREWLAVRFFCSDETGAAAEVESEIRCIQDCDDTSVFGRALKAGEVQRVRGCLLYVLDGWGRIGEIKAPPPEVLEPWRRV